MKKLILSLFLCGGSLLAVSPEDEIDLLKELIRVTKKNLEGQEKMLVILQNFAKLREAFIQDPTSGKLATLLVRAATQLKGKIEEEHLEHLFSNDLMTEILFFTKVGQTQKIPS